MVHGTDPTGLLLRHRRDRGRGPKGKWEAITADDLEKATPKIEKGDIVIIHTHMHAKFGDNKDYFGRSPGLVPSAAEWLVEKGVKAVGVDQQALDHPLATAIRLPRTRSAAARHLRRV
jgi:kynurenine formamidase